MFAKLRLYIRRALRITFVVLVLIAIPLLYQRWTILKTQYLEKDAPGLEVLARPEGIGVEPLPLILRIKDSGAGIDEVVIKAQQRDWKLDLLREHLGGKFFDFITTEGPLSRTREVTLPVKLPTQKDGLRPGKLSLYITVFDRSVWSNKLEEHIELDVDFSKPIIEPLTPQQNASTGGCEIVYYKLRSKNGPFVGISGVQWKDSLFKGVPASLIDKAFEQQKDVYVSLFPVPLDYKASENKFRIYAKDKVGNSVSVPFVQNIREISYGKRSLSLSIPLCENQEFNNTIEQRETTEEKNLRTLLAQFEEQTSERLFSGKFLQFAARQIAFFGEHRTLKDSEARECGFTTLYNEFAYPEDSQILSPNRGKVVFADVLGSRGATVIIDHGLGFFSLYYFLDQLEVTAGQMIESGEKIGTAGTSGMILDGLTEPTRLGFELRIHGVPIRATEWWDGKWQREHIDDEVRFVKKNLGLYTVEEKKAEKGARKK